VSIFDRIVEYSNISKPSERVPKEDGGMLVQPSDDGSRPGYKGPEQQFKPVEGAPSRVQFDTDKQLYRKMVQETVGGVKKNKYIYSEPGESLEQFMGRKPIRSTGADDATVQARQFIDNWTKNWFDENLKNYDVKNFDEMLSKLSNDWEIALESENVPKGSRGFKLKTSKLGLPNITTLADAKIKSDLTPFEYNGVRFYKNLEGDPTQLGKTLAQYKKVFYKNQIENNPELRKDLNKFFDFMSSDKRGQYKKLDGKTIKQFMDTEVSDDVKFLLNDKASGLGKDSKFEVFNSYDDLADNYNTFTQDKARLKAIQIESESMSKVGEKTKNQYLKVKESIKNQNDVLAKMSVEDIAKNKKLLNSVRMVINPISGEVSYTNYTVNDPKGKPALDDIELAKKIKQKALDGKFFVTEHISKRSLEKLNTAFPNNIQLANYMSNVQLENARRFLSIPENRNTVATQNLDKALEQTGLTIRGPEYGGIKYGNKINIEVPASTGKSNIVESQSIGGQQFVKTEQNILKNITSYSKLPECKVGKAEGGRIGFALSDTCIRDGLLEQKKLAASGNKKAAQELVDVAKVASRGGLLKNVLGPGAILGEAVFEGAIIGNKVLGGKPLREAWAESYLSYLDPRKYRGELDPMLMERDRMLQSTADKNILRSGFSAQDQLSAFNKAIEERDLAKSRGRIDQYLPAAAEAREQGRLAGQSADVISSEAFKDATKVAQEYLQGQSGKQQADFGVLSVPQGDDPINLRRLKAMREMKNLYTQYSDQDLIKMLEDAGYNPQDIIDLKTTERLTPSFARTLGGLDVLRSQFQEQEAMQRIADAGGVANLAGGGIAKLAGVSKGPPPESGPNPQGLNYLIKRVTNS
jgi:hypothetical protein